MTHMGHVKNGALMLDGALASNTPPRVRFMRAQPGDSDD
jgi:hypothetical protein